MYSSYGPLATEVYDRDKPVGRSFGDIEFYRDILLSRSGPVLEPAVGSGRILIPLIEAGIEVDGVDTSEEMLSSCRKRCHDRGIEVSLYKGSMVNFSIPKRYSALIVPTGSFLLMEKREDSVKALATFGEHLSAGGLFVVDLIFPDSFDTTAPTFRSWVTLDGAVITLESRLVEVNFLNQTTTSLFRYEKWREGRLVDSELERFSLRWYGIDEFQMILKKVGYKVKDIVFNYSKSSSGESNSDVVTVIAEWTGR